MERDYPPLSASCVKNLVDKLFDKRKQASVEIERLTKESLLQDKRGEIFKLIGYFSQDFIMSPNPNTRKGGLLGLASVTIGLGQNAGLFYTSILPPVLRTFHDNDSRVRYYACETLYNIMKITRRDTVYLLNEVFDVVSRGVSDTDLNVRQGATQCNRLLKEIVTEPDFVNLSVIVSLLRERIYTNNPFARQFIVSWASALYAVPGLKISLYLPQLLDGLFRILGDPTPDIRRQCEILLNDLLNEIVMNPKEIAFDAMINILLVHCRLSGASHGANGSAAGSLSMHASPFVQDSDTVSLVMDPSNQTASVVRLPSPSSQPGYASSGEQLRQRTALTWIRAFVELDTIHLLPFASGIIGAVLPCFLIYNAADNVRDRRVTVETAVRINETLLNFVRTSKSIASNASSVPLRDQSHVEKSAGVPKETLVITSLGAPESSAAENQADYLPHSRPTCTGAILDVTCRLLDHQSLLTRLAALQWIEVLGKVNPKEVLPHVVRLLPLMLDLLADPSTDVVHSVVRLVGNLCNHPGAIDLLNEPSIVVLMNIPQDLCTLLLRRSPQNRLTSAIHNTQSDAYNYNPFCVRFLVDLVSFFDKNASVLVQRGDLIITDLCEILSADVVYRTLSTIISHTTELHSAFVLVRVLNRILLIEPSIHKFRNRLRSINTEDGCLLLEGLCRAWCYNPVALLSLYMLTQNYQQSSRLIKSFGEVSITIDTLVEMDQLIQMIESPIFSTLRMHLLDKRYSADLRETLYCLLMCLPQTEAFHTLWRRLQCVPPVTHLSEWPVVCGHAQPDIDLMHSHIPFDDLFEYFHTVQQRCTTAHQQQFQTGKSNIETMYPLVPNGLTNVDSSSSLNRSALSHELRYANETTKGKPAVVSAGDYLVQSLSKLGINVSQNTEVS